MKHYLAILCLLVLTPLASTAQINLGGIVKKAASAVSGASDIEAAILGSKTISSSAVNGTWVYEEPAIVFESANLASCIGGAIAASNVESKLKGILSKSGFTPGKLSVTFNSKAETYIAKYNGKSISGHYEIKGSTLILTKEGFQSVKCNISLNGKKLQLAIQADKLLELANTISDIATKNSSLSSITTLLKNYKGIQLGLKFKK